MPTPEVSVQVGAVTLQVWEGDLTQAEAAAVVNAANNHLWMGSGVAGALKRLGGEEIEAEAIAQGPIPVGSAVATTAGKLPYRAVIHGAVMGQDLRTSADLIARTTRACLDLAEAMQLDSLALPAFGTGVGGIVFSACARAMLGATAEFARGEPRYLRRVVFVPYGAEAEAAFATELQVLIREGGII
jgi:O-acetyl-ADP-ribose deacetylase (regulator of RNase III)